MGYQAVFWLWRLPGFRLRVFSLALSQSDSVIRIPRFLPVSPECLSGLFRGFLEIGKAVTVAALRLVFPLEKKIMYMFLHL